MHCKRWQLFLLVFTGPAHDPAVQAVRALRSGPVHPSQSIQSRPLTAMHP